MFEDYNIIRKTQRNADINISPLIDMVFILLIFFIVTTNFNRETGVEVTKPKATSAISQGQKTILVGITREGTVHVDGRQLTIDALRNFISQEVVKRPDASVVVVSDQDAAVKRMVQVMDICVMAGAQKVSIAAEQDGK